MSLPCIIIKEFNDIDKTLQICGYAKLYNKHNNYIRNAQADCCESRMSDS